MNHRTIILAAVAILSASQLGVQRLTTQPALVASATKIDDLAPRRMSSKAARDAWRSSISAPGTGEKSSDLDEAIRRLQAMERRLPAKAAQSAKPAAQAQVAPVAK